MLSCDWLVDRAVVTRGAVITTLSGGVPTHQKYKVAEGEEQERETFPPVGTAWLRGSSTVNCAPGDGGGEVKLLSVSTLYLCLL